MHSGKIAVPPGGGELYYPYPHNLQGIRGMPYKRLLD
jgi:hypothetical protein